MYRMVYKDGRVSWTQVRGLAYNRHRMGYGVDNSTVAAIVAASGAIGAALVKVFDVLMAMYRAKKTDDREGQAILFKEWQKIIESHQHKILQYEEDLQKIRDEHVDCLKENAVLRARIADLEKEVGSLGNRIRQMEGGKNAGASN